MDDFLRWMGVLFLIVIIYVVAVGAYYALYDWINGLVRDYRIKHRFDKSPTARCYCKDCVHHDPETHQCYRFGETTDEYRCTADHWFCWEAVPRKEIGD